MKEISGPTARACYKDQRRWWVYCAWQAQPDGGACELSFLVSLSSQAHGWPFCSKGDVLSISWNHLSHIPLLGKRKMIWEACPLALMFIYLFQARLLKPLAQGTPAMTFWFDFAERPFLVRGKDVACIGAEILVLLEKLHRNKSLCISQRIWCLCLFFSVPKKVRFFQLMPQKNSTHCVWTIRTLLFRMTRGVVPAGPPAWLIQGIIENPCKEIFSLGALPPDRGRRRKPLVVQGCWVIRHFHNNQAKRARLFCCCGSSRTVSCVEETFREDFCRVH